jgi:hypothetical protein
MEENVTVQDTQLERLKLRIPFDEDTFEDFNKYIQLLEMLLEDSKNIALSEIYPYEDFSEMELPKKYLNWQIRASVELYNLGDKDGIISYSENGLSWTKDSSRLSKALMSEITRKAGVPKNV